MDSIEEARELLKVAGVFFYDEEDLGPEEVSDEYAIKMMQTLNMNDVWAWACADGEYVSDEELPEVARLFCKYGWCGILYWVSNKNNGMRSEFLDNNRFIDFVKNEEQLIKDIPDSDTRAYNRIIYTLGEK